MFGHELVFAGGGIAVIAAAAIAIYDLLLAAHLRQAAVHGRMAQPATLHWRTGLALVVVAWVPLLLAMSVASR